ncbi:MAG: ABC transporter permease [Aquamicrobium sp.]|uniref:ABC transporter permease n=1 Tax=Aquamicrobium sp. TaxID=1872579 RepID=UPI00349E717C|nr:ABC transporter permease [Aquamicrobium sp.]MCO5157938.1 ABC transporter permease [Aquamicrobium sp.]
MLLFVASRLLKAAVVLIAILTLNFLLIHAAPGDPVFVLAGEAGAADALYIEQLRERFGLDRPLLQQLGIYLGGILQFDLGFSYRQQMPVMDLILQRLPATLLLTTTAFIIALTVGTLAGALAAARVRKWSDTVISTAALFFYATPLFWVALMAVLVFSVYLEWLPGFGYETVGGRYTGLDRALDIGRHLILPATTLGLFFTAVYVRMTRASMLEVAQQDFVKTAHAKGLKPGLIQRRHVFRNAMLPVVTLAGLQAGQLVGGAVLTETVFAWPGIGRLMFEALTQRDYNVLLGVFFVSAAMVLFFNLITDILYRVVDPRIRAA